MQHLTRHRSSAADRGSIIAFLLLALAALTLVAAAAALQSRSGQTLKRGVAYQQAYQLADSAVSAGVKAVDRALVSGAASIGDALIAAGYRQATSAAGTTFTATKTLPGTDGSAVVTILFTEPVTMPTSAVVSATGTRDGVEATARAQVSLDYGAQGVLISTNPGTTANDISSAPRSKATALAGNVTMYTTVANSILIRGGVLANGTTTYSPLTTIDATAVAANLRDTEAELPDYTAPGSSAQLFDFGRFIAAADAMGTHYANPAAMRAAQRAATGGVLEGVIVVDVPTSITRFTSSTTTGAAAATDFYYPEGIKVRGTLVFNFAAGWSAMTTPKLKLETSVSINPADLSTLSTAGEGNYPTGFPAAIANPSRRAANVNITSRGYANFTANDTLPALLYNNAFLDFHAAVNVCGAIYSPCFAEIENKLNNNTQYISGCIIVGSGIFVENTGTTNSRTIITYDPRTLQRLATMGTRGKRAFVTQRQ